MTEEMMVDS
jgi:hypothetical protein